MQRDPHSPRQTAPAADRARTSAGASGKKAANNLVVLGSAAVVAVYTAGYLRTRAAAQQLEEAALRRPPVRLPSMLPADEAPVLKPASAAAPVESSGPAALSQSASATPAATMVMPTRPVERTVNEGAKSIAPPGSDRASTSSTATPAAPEIGAPGLQPGGALPGADAPGLQSSAAVASPSTIAATPAAPTAAPAATAPVSEPPAASAAVALVGDAPAPPAQPRGRYAKDGSFTGWGTSRHGDIHATVVIVNGRITSARISMCLTRYSCNWIDPLPPQVLQRQSAEVDYVSGATESTYAYYYAVVEALSKAK